MKEMRFKIIVSILAILMVIISTVLYFNKTIDLDNLIILYLGAFANWAILYEMEFDNSTNNNLKK